VYFLFATLSFYTVFDRDTVMNHPRILENQIYLEIAQAARAMPLMAVFTVPFFLVEIRGFTKLYDSASEAPWPWYQWAQFPLFLVFTDCCVYWIHRGLHHPLAYKALHKPHHRWLMPTPYASHAFHPLDGFAQSLPYHIFPFLFPLQKLVYVLLFVLVNIWTIIIHDGEFASHGPVLNGAAHHTVHHLYFNYNYGQYTTLWDRIGGSYRTPDEALLRSESRANSKGDGEGIGVKKGL
jgi:lathosterol oxidase